MTEPGGPEVLAVEQRSAPDPGPGELQVELAAAGVNFIDIYQRQGVYPTPTPFVAGNEGAGSVTAVGLGVSGFTVGDIVGWASVPGSASSVVNIPADRAVLVPDKVAPDLAAAAMLQGMTAHYLVTSTYPVQSGDTAVVHAAAGGVGQLLVQLIRSRGARVIATVSSAEKEAKARALGADEVIRYTSFPESEALAAEIRRVNGDRGVTVVYDGVGKSTFDASIDSLAPRGMLVLFGGSSGQVPPFDLQRLNSAGSLFVTRPTLVHYIATRDELLWRGGEVLRWIADGALRVEIGGRYPFEQAAQAYDDLASRRTTGKLLLLP